MVVITNLTTSSTYVPPADTVASFTKQIGLTQMPIPMLDNPILLNFGGATPQITLSWKTLNQADVVNLINNFASASQLGGYKVDLTTEWGAGAVFQGYVYNLEVTQNAGELVYSVSWTLWIGSIV